MKAKFSFIWEDNDPERTEIQGWYWPVVRNPTCHLAKQISEMHPLDPYNCTAWDKPSSLQIHSVFPFARHHSENTTLGSLQWESTVN